jgi:predicted metal-dependent hydrolase
MKSGPFEVATPEGRLRYTISHRPRVTRRMHLELDGQGDLRVVVPRAWSAAETHELLRRNARQVGRFLVRARKRRLPPLHYGDNGEHLLGGEPRILRLRAGTARPALRLDGDTLWLTVKRPADTGPEQVRRLLSAWYDREARRLFRERFDALRPRADWARDRDLQLCQRRMKRTWGSCSRRGVIRLNTHLVKAPVACLDYVIAHELCHLQVMNHGPDFYALQERLWPEWRTARAHLRTEGHRYTRE